MKKIKVERIKEFRKNYPIMLFFIFSNFINALLLRLNSSGVIGFRAIFFDLGFLILFAGISYFIPKKRVVLYYWIVTLIMVACCIINSIYYNYYASFVSVSLIATSVFVKDVTDAVVDFAIKITDWIYLWTFIGLFMVVRKYKRDETLKKNNMITSLLLSLAVVGIGCALPPYNSWGRLFKLWNRVSVVNNWGPYIYQVDDMVQSLKPTFNNIFGYDKALSDTNEYYDKHKFQAIENEYTGIFEGKNVIAIHAESLQSFVMDMSFNGKKVTPNLNKLRKTGMYFSNFYSQVGVGTSSDTEFTYATSLLPANNGTVFVNYFNNKFVTIQNLLNNKGYYVFSMHGNVGDFWNREAMHMNMGYDKFYSKSSFVIDEEYGLGLSDKSFFRQVVPMIKDIKNSINGPFYGTLITLTNHTPWRDTKLYSDYDVSMNINIDSRMVNKSYLEDRAMGKYIKSVNYMDMAIGNFINDMDAAGLLDNTVIVIYGDHDAKLGKNEFNYMYNYNPLTDDIRDQLDPQYVEFSDYDYELIRKVPFIIWTKDMNNGINIDTPMGMIDVLPTLGNMLNIYNKYALGKDVMGAKDNIVVFKDGSYITDKIYYSAKNNDVYALSNGVIPDGYVNKNGEYADKIIQISDNIITYDLIKDLK